MAEEQLHSIRFRRDDVEFEMTASASDIASAWARLEPVLMTVLGEATRETGRTGARETQREAADSRRRRRAATSRARQEGDRADIANQLASAAIDEFPELGQSPQGLYVAYAALKWARDELGIDGLTPSEIQHFAAQRLRLRNTQGAYRNALNRAGRAVDVRGNRPQVFHLMAPGERALEAYVREVERGGSPDEAEAAGQAAESEAEAES
jgi:hypothetical protein